LKKIGSRGISGVLMFFLNLPWVIGPIPIAATIWAAYACFRSIVWENRTGDEVFFAALLLPAGVTAIACQMFLSELSFTVLLISGQFVSSLCFFLLLIGRRSAWPIGISNLKSERTALVVLKNVAVLAAIYTALNVIVFIFPGPDKCSIAKCFALEWMLGRVDHVFSRLYLETTLGAMFLIGIMSQAFELLSKVRRYRFFDQ
jgi:hypothetical protein